jgi:hypothetical protein
MPSSRARCATKESAQTRRRTPLKRGSYTFVSDAGLVVATYAAAGAGRSPEVIDRREWYPAIEGTLDVR